jgi:hypothetical protein
MIRRLKAWIAGRHAWYYLGNADNVNKPDHKELMELAIGKPKGAFGLDGMRRGMVNFIVLPADDQGNEYPIAVTSQLENSTPNHINPPEWMKQAIEEGLVRKHKSDL